MQYNEQGQAALITVLVIMSVVLIMALGVGTLSIVNLTIVRNVVRSSQSYYTAEAGAEDALLRLVQGKNFSNPYTLQVGGATTTVDLSAPIGGARIVTSTGNKQGRYRKVQVGYAPATTEVSFFYGAQIGDGGLTMDNNSQVVGNVFSNATISGSGEITETATVAGNGNKLDGITVGADANVHTCEDSTIGGTLTYVSGGSVVRCTAGSTVDGGPSEIQPLDFPITDENIDDWRSDAATGGTLTGDQTISSNTTLGPKKIDGNLTISNNVVVTLTGTVWVTGTFTPGNNAQIVLDTDAYGDNSGIMIVDGEVHVDNNVILSGTGSSTSYLLVVGASTSTDIDNPAIDVVNNVDSAILFAPYGLMRLRNNVDLVEATAYQMHLDNNAVITYEIGLQNTTFSSGPSGGSGVVSWKEVE